MIELYEHPESGNSHKARLLLSFLDLPYQSINVDLFEQEHRREPFLSLNPRAEVPVLREDEIVLRDSMAILIYLAKRHDPARRWLPEGFAEEGAVHEWLAFAASWIQYGVFTARAAVSFGMMANGLPFDFPTDPREGQARGRRSLEIMQARLGEREWLAAGHATIADVACFPYIALAPMGDVALDPYPGVVAWIERFQKLPGFLDMPGLRDPNYRRS